MVYLNNYKKIYFYNNKKTTSVLASADFLLGTTNSYSKEFATPSKIYSYIAAEKAIICKIINKYSNNKYKIKKTLTNLKNYRIKYFDIDKIANKFNKIIQA